MTTTVPVPPKRTTLKKMLIALSVVGVALVAAFLANGGERIVRDAFKNYFPSKPASKPGSHVKVQEKKDTEQPKMDWRASPVPGAKFLTDEEIKYDGGKPLLVIIGHVFDVTNGFKSYQPGSGYHGFIGQDASRAFVTGQFDKEGLISDLTGLSSSDYSGLAEWLGFYIKTYPFVGYLYGTYFDKEKNPTPAFKEFLRMQDVAKEAKTARESVQKEFPSCNVEWSEKDGTNVWCSLKSGGVERDWIGFPALFKETPDKEPRCACLREFQFKDPRIQFYKGCDHKSHRCNRVEK